VTGGGGCQGLPTQRSALGEELCSCTDRCKGLLLVDETMRKDACGGRDTAKANPLADEALLTLPTQMTKVNLHLMAAIAPISGGSCRGWLLIGSIHIWVVDTANSDEAILVEAGGEVLALLHRVDGLFSSSHPGSVVHTRQLWSGERPGHTKLVGENPRKALQRLSRPRTWSHCLVLGVLIDRSYPNLQKWTFD